MDSYEMPDLRLPFETASHPDAEHVQELTEAWCLKFGLLRSPSVARKFRALGYGRIMATLTPWAPLEGLALITDWNSFFFVTDDQQNIGVTTGRVARYEGLVASMRRVIGGDSRPTVHEDHPLIAALRDLLDRTLVAQSLHSRPDDWVTRFRGNLDLWLTGHLAENAYRQSGTVPTVEDYVAVRRAASTVLPTVDLVELVEGATVPDVLYRSPQYQTVVQGTADIMCWINDIHSLHMEQGDPINLVTVLDHHEHLGVQRAIDAVAARVASRVDDHLAATRELPAVLAALGVAEPEAVLRCVRDQQSWAAGMEAWDRTDTIRFSAAEATGAKASYVDDLLDWPTTA
ncbi:hypothetical protein VSH64_33000 [Amycolatopsis rhabdoformis]|uniref:Terpene synthase n=1 Tax=Amycolatopsis rhabdoformis TaxID=1448059 RepID=A0ABZ1HZT0_9PSEU|nr:hypothetical protein [Amycolatopsis rhabdoformis]WSE27646.1 hypothetical protein VSH64_33000 [Amycolatopsis rhabdoformis]